MIKRWGLASQGLASYQTVSSGYFAALGIPLLRGRFFDDRDRPGAPLSAVVNQALVRKFFPHEDPIGRRIAIDRGTDFLRRMTIVGVVGDALLDGMNAQALPELFAAFAQLPSEDAWMVVRASGDVGSVGSAIQNAVHNIDPEIGVVKVATLASAVGDSLWRERFSALLVGVFAALAVLIATGGLYAVISRAVQRRTQEIGVRLALGAGRGRIAQTVLGHGFRVTAIGIVAGTLLAVVLARMLAQQSYELSDLPWMVAAIAAALLLVTLAACSVPLRTALRVDPVTALRSE